MKKSVLFYAVLPTLAGSIAIAGVVDLRDLPNNFDQSSWGHPDTTMYAQSVQATDVFLDEFRFRATSFSAGGINYTLVITGARADAGGLGWAPDLTDIRYESAVSNIDGSGIMNEAVFNPNINVNNGELLFFVLNTYTVGPTGIGTVRATEFNGPDQYLPGEFVFLNTGGPGNSLNDLIGADWSHRFDNGEDLAIFASFSVPTPGTLFLLGAGALAGTRRRR